MKPIESKITMQSCDLYGIVFLYCSLDTKIAKQWSQIEFDIHGFPEWRKI
jgi:hypothetical protein